MLQRATTRKDKGRWPSFSASVSQVCVIRSKCVLSRIHTVETNPHPDPLAFTKEYLLLVY